MLAVSSTTESEHERSNPVPLSDLTIELGMTENVD